MQKIPLKQATPGMTLAKPVINDRGMTLVGAGTRLTEDTIERLVGMEVKRITVEGHARDPFLVVRFARNLEASPGYTEADIERLDLPPNVTINPGVRFLVTINR